MRPEQSNAYYDHLCLTYKPVIAHGFGLDTLNWRRLLRMDVVNARLDCRGDPIPTRAFPASGHLL